MTKTSVDAGDGSLARQRQEGLSDRPLRSSASFRITTPNGGTAWAEIAGAGVTFVRNYTVWTAAAAAEQMISLEQELDAATDHGLQVWLALAGVDNDLSRQRLLDSDRHHAEEPSRTGRLERGRRAGTRTCAGIRVRRRLPAPAVARSRPPSRDSSRRREDRAPTAGGRDTPLTVNAVTAVRSGLRHPRHRHLPRLDPRVRTRAGRRSTPTSASSAT